MCFCKGIASLIRPRISIAVVLIMFLLVMSFAVAFNVTFASSSSASIALSSDTGSAGQSVVISGSGFSPSALGTTVIVTFDGSPPTTSGNCAIASGGALPSSQGCSFIVPNSASAGPHTVKVCDDTGICGSSTFSVGSTSSTTTSSSTSSLSSFSTPTISTSATSSSSTPTFSMPGGSSSSSSITGTSAPAGITLMCPPFSMLGPPTPCIANVAGKAPTGTVTFNLVTGSGSFPFGNPCTLAQIDSAHSICIGAFEAFSAGTVTLSASYSGDSQNPSSTSSTVTLTIKKAPTFTSVSCSPSSVSLGSSITCIATTSYIPGPSVASPTGTITFTGSTISGSPFSLSFTPSNGECALSGTPFPSCSVSFTSSAPGLVSVKATYGGDSNYEESAGPTLVGEGLTASTVTISSCTSPLASIPGTCTVTVTGSNPTGIVFFPADNSAAGIGKPPLFYAPPGCTLASVSSTSAQCTMTFVDINPGSSAEVKAVYPGDSNNGPSAGSTTVTIGSTPAISSLSASCNPTSVIIGSPVTCTVSVNPSSFNGYVFVTASSLGANGLIPVAALMPSFQFCQLTSGSCEVTFTGTMPGETTVSAYVPGQSPASAGQVTVSPGTGSNTQNSGTGSAIFQGGQINFQTGLPCLDPSSCSSISFTPPPSDAGDQFSTTFRLLNGTDQGVGSPNLGNAQFGDVSITISSGGTSPSNTLVNVCLPDASADSNTVLQYWDSSTSSWVSATNIIVTLGVKVCGDMPLSVLNGRNIAAGDLSTTSSSTSVQTSSSVTTTKSSSETISSTAFVTTSSSTTFVSSQVQPTTKSSQTSSGGGIPEFPFEPAIAVIFTIVILGSYMIIRRRYLSG